jgi:hypothetical protein
MNIVINIVKHWYRRRRAIDAQTVWLLFRSVTKMGRGWMAVPGAKNKIEDVVLRWPEVTSKPHRFGGTEYRLGKREIGHLHGNHLLDIPFPKRVRNEVVEAGRAEPHHILPKSGWVSLYLREAADIDRAVELLRLSYELARKKS